MVRGWGRGAPGAEPLTHLHPSLLTLTGEGTDSPGGTGMPAGPEGLPGEGAGQASSGTGPNVTQAWSGRGPDPPPSPILPGHPLHPGFPAAPGRPLGSPGWCPKGESSQTDPGPVPEVPVPTWAPALLQVSSIGHPAGTPATLPTSCPEQTRHRRRASADSGTWRQVRPLLTLKGPGAQPPPGVRGCSPPGSSSLHSRPRGLLYILQIPTGHILLEEPPSSAPQAGTGRRAWADLVHPGEGLSPPSSGSRQGLPSPRAPAEASCQKRLGWQGPPASCGGMGTGRGRGMQLPTGGGQSHMSGQQAWRPPPTASLSWAPPEGHQHGGQPSQPHPARRQGSRPRAGEGAES